MLTWRAGGGRYWCGLGWAGLGVGLMVAGAGSWAASLMMAATAGGWQGCYPGSRRVWLDAFRMAMAVRSYVAIRFRSQAWSSHFRPLAVQSGHGR